MIQFPGKFDKCPIVFKVSEWNLQMMFSVYMSVKRCVTFPQQIMILGSIVNSDFSLSHFCFEITKCYWPVHYAVLLQYTGGKLDIKVGHLARHTPCHAMKYWHMGCRVFSWKIHTLEIFYCFVQNSLS